MPPNVPPGIVYTSMFIAAGMTGLVGYTAYEVYVVGHKPAKIRWESENQRNNKPHDTNSG